MRQAVDRYHLIRIIPAKRSARMATMLPPSNDVLSRDPFPSSTKVYAIGSDPTIRVPFRAIALSDGTAHTVTDSTN